jgi:hypothetical protein
MLRSKILRPWLHAAKRRRKNEAQEQRIAAMQRDGFLVARGPIGLTVLRVWGR